MSAPPGWCEAATIRGQLRSILGTRLVAAAQSGAFADAAALLAGYVDTWPLSAIAEPAWARWQHAPEGAALSALARLAEIWSLIAEPPAPLPLPHPPPAHAALPGEDLAARRAELASALVRGEIAGALLTSPVPLDPASQLALGEIRLEGGAAQRALERYGPPGLLAPDAPPWESALPAAPPGTLGPRLRRTGDAVILPGTPAGLRRGAVQATGWLLWEAPRRPLPVRPEAVALLRGLDQGWAAACAAAGVDDAAGAAMLEELASVGAVTAAV